MNVRFKLPALLLVVLVAVALRVWDLPARYEVRASDELPCIEGSLELLEGITPAQGYAPAGPQTWLGWTYAAFEASRYSFKPTKEERAVPFEVRSFIAINHALFDLYRDLSGLRRFMIVISDVLSVLAVMAAFAVGARHGGLAGAVLLGGFFAVAPFLIEHADQARSFSMAWSFLMIGVYFAVCHSGKTALWGAGICLGLSIAQRVEMIVLTPLIWLEYWYSLRQLTVTASRSLALILRQTGITLATALVLAPWWLIDIVENVRAIAMDRFSIAPVAAFSWKTKLVEFSWTQGLGIIALLFIAGSLWGIFRRTLGRPLLCVFVLLLLPSVIQSTGHEIAHHAAAILALFIAAPLALIALGQSAKVVWALVSITVLLPFAMAVKMIHHQRTSYVPDDATVWVENHVPMGSLVMITPGLHNLLPTPTCADTLWQEEMNNDAAAKKLKNELTRFHVVDLELPRALSEENMIKERAGRRSWYVLGSRSWLPDRRFDIRPYELSKAAESSDPMPEFNRTGGVLVWRGGPIKALKEPLVKWVDANAVGTYIYCSDNLRLPPKR